MIHMNVIIWSRVSSQSQDNQRQILNLKQVAAGKGWTVKRVFQETVSGTVKTTDRKEFNKLLEYVDLHEIKLVLVSEISRIGRRVVDILTTVDTFHKRGIAIYVQQFNMLSLQDGKENPMVMMLLQMLSIGAEMENNHRKIRQSEGIAIAKLQNKYVGRKNGSKANKERMLKKYADVVDLINKSDLSIRRIAGITDRSINTVIKVKKLLDAA
jgi:DNA invertase Pin-like site-specific DNA recombinase